MFSVSYNARHLFTKKESLSTNSVFSSDLLFLLYDYINNHDTPHSDRMRYTVPRSSYTCITICKWCCINNELAGIIVRNEICPWVTWTVAWLISRQVSSKWQVWAIIRLAQAIRQAWAVIMQLWAAMSNDLTILWLMCSLLVSLMVCLPILGGCVTAASTCMGNWPIYWSHHSCHHISAY